MEVEVQEVLQVDRDPTMQHSCNTSSTTRNNWDQMKEPSDKGIMIMIRTFLKINDSNKNRQFASFMQQPSAMRNIKNQYCNETPRK